MGLLLLLAGTTTAPAQGIYAQFMNNAQGSAPETAVASVLDLGTNVYFLGRYYGYTNKIGNVTMTNEIAVSNLFVAEFENLVTRNPPWAIPVVTEIPVLNARMVNGLIVAGSFGGTNLSVDGATLTNYASPAEGSEDVFIAGLTSYNGGLNWLIQLGGSGEDTLGDLEEDPSRSPSGFYVTGSFQSPTFSAGVSNLVRQSTYGADFYVAKFNMNGKLLWINQGAYAAGTCMAIDTSNDCYVGGITLGPATFGGTAPSDPTTTNFLAKYDSAGNLLWVRGDVPPVSQLAADQNVYMAGTFSNVLQYGSTTLSNNSPSTIFLARCDTTGSPLWVESLPGWGNDGVGNILIDGGQNCWLAGYFASSSQTALPTNSTAIVGWFDFFGNVLGTTRVAGGPSTAVSVTGGILNSVFNISFCGTYTTNLEVYGPYKNYAVTNKGNADIYAAVVGTNPQLKLSLSGTNLVCSWPFGPNYFQLQTITNLFGSSWTSVSGPTVNGQFVVTNSVSGNARFYRLVKSTGL